MKQERFMVIDNQKGVIIPLQEEKEIRVEQICEGKTMEDSEIILEEKVKKIHTLIKALVRQSIQETIKEYKLKLTEELKEYEQVELKRWEKLEQRDSVRWDKLEKMELEHMEKLESQEEKRWQNLEKQEKERFDRLENNLEKHFKSLDKNIRQKQVEGKRKKHSIF